MALSTEYKGTFRKVLKSPLREGDSNPHAYVSVDPNHVVTKFPPQGKYNCTVLHPLSDLLRPFLFG